jgi:hypothetical protein
LIEPAEDLEILHTFFDALDAGKACRHLEASAIPFSIENLSRSQQGVSKFLEDPPIQIELLVRAEDLQRARECLRESMYLFPEREMGVVEHGGEREEVIVQAAACETEEDAESVQAVLTEAGLWSRRRQIFDEEDPTYLTHSVEVKAGEVEKSQAALERWATRSED